MTEKIKNIKTSLVHQRFYSIYKTILSYCLKCRNNTKSKNLKVAKKKKVQCFHQNVRCVIVKN